MGRAELRQPGQESQPGNGVKSGGDGWGRRGAGEYFVWLEGQLFAQSVEGGLRVEAF